MDKSANSLSYALRPSVLRYYLSRLSLVLAGLTVVPLSVALAFGELPLALRLAAIIGILVLFWSIGRRTTSPRLLQVNEALATVALTFVLTPLLMVWPFMGGQMHLDDALFESVSAITTTGLSTVARVHDLSPGLLFLRSWMQWYGGLGIAVFSIALALGHQSGARRLTGLDRPEDLASSAGTYAHQVLLAYLGLTVTAFIALWLTIGNGFQALLHALTAVSTGGFSAYDNSLADMPSVVGPYLTICASLLGALPLVLYYQIFSNRRRGLSGDPEWWALPLVVVVVALLLTLSLRIESGMDWSTALYHGSLLGASAQTTAGFSSTSVAMLGDTAKLLLILAMLCGGSVGSTAGGIKLLRLLILGKLVTFMLRRTTMPSHAVASMRLGGRRLEAEEVQRALVVIVLFLLTVLLSWSIMVAGGQPALDALFEVASATGTVGLSSGIVNNELPTGLKLLLCLDMLLGRLEILALLVLMYPPTWLGRRIENQ